ALIMGDDDECESKPALQIHQLELRLATQFFIQRRHRLIKQQHARPLDERTRERDTLTLSAGYFVRLAADERLEFQPRQHVVVASGIFSLGWASRLKTECKISHDVRCGNKA